jgi:Negative regulator of sigma F
VNDSQIDKIFESDQQVDTALLERVSASITTALQPVRPLPPVWKLVAALMSIAALYAIAAAWWLGMSGVQKLSGAGIALIFSVLGVCLLLVAIITIREMTPGSAWRIGPWKLLVLVIAGFVAVDAVLFQDYSASRFVPQGVACLKAGLAVALPTGVTSWFVLRRGLAVSPSSAGLSAGTLAGLAGLVMLELHCPNFQAPHVMVWHTAVIPLSALVGMSLALLRRTRST